MRDTGTLFPYTYVVGLAQANNKTDTEWRYEARLVNTQKNLGIIVIYCRKTGERLGSL